MPRSSLSSLLRILVSFAAFLVPAFARAQADARAGDRLWRAWVGFSSDSPIDTYWGGTTQGRSLFLMGVGVHYVVETVGGVAIAYTAEVIPAAVVSDNPRWRWRELQADGRVYEFKDPVDSASVYGAGIAPLGLHLSAPVWRGVRVFGAGSVGGIWFTREMPVPYAQSFNYALDFGGGLDVAAGATHVVVIGFKVHHLSNMDSAPANPGLDGHVFYVGVMRRRRPAK